MARSRGLGDVYKRQTYANTNNKCMFDRKFQRIF
jgi:hypothetical protein